MNVITARTSYESGFRKVYYCRKRKQFTDLFYMSCLYPTRIGAKRMFNKLAFKGGHWPIVDGQKVKEITLGDKE